MQVDEKMKAGGAYMTLAFTSCVLETRCAAAVLLAKPVLSTANQLSVADALELDKQSCRVL